MSIKKTSTFFFLIILIGSFPLLSFIISYNQLPKSLLVTSYHLISFCLTIIIIMASRFRKNILIFLGIIFWLFFIFKMAANLFIDNIYVSGRLSNFEYVFYFISTFLCFISGLVTSKLETEKSKNHILFLILIGVVFSFITNFDSENLITGFFRFSGNDYLQTLYFSHYSISGFLILLMIFFSVKHSLLKNIIILFLLLLLAYFVVIGGSRGPVLALSICSFFLLFHFRVSIIKLIILFIFPMTYFITTSSIYDNLQMIGFSTIINRFESNDISARSSYYSEALNTFYNNPIFGGPFLLQKGAAIGSYPHNFFIEVLMTGGLFLFILFVILIIFGFKNLIKNFRTKSFTFIDILFLQYFLLGMTSGALWSSKIFWFLLGLQLLTINNNYIIKNISFERK